MSVEWLNGLNELLNELNELNERGRMCYGQEKKEGDSQKGS